MSWKLKNYLAPTSFKGFTVYVATYLHNQGEVTYFTTMKWASVQKSKANKPMSAWLQSCAKRIKWLYGLRCPNVFPFPFPISHILHSVLSQSTGWGLIRLDTGYHSLVWSKNGHRISFLIFSMKRDTVAFCLPSIFQLLFSYIAICIPNVPYPCA